MPASRNTWSVGGADPSGPERAGHTNPHSTAATPPASKADKVRKGYLDHSIERNLDFLEATLAASTWFTGEDLTAADVQMSFAVEAAAVRNDLSGRYPNLAAFLERVRERPAYRAALEKGGPYSLLDR